jgi:(p)ppGpp synthase/HD superfamily hydrolase
VALTERFDDALVFASRLHAGQIRKGSRTPYIAHLLAVTAIVLEHGGTENEAIAALLHDAVEDQGGQRTLDEIRRRFGQEVAAIVLGCTDTDQVHKPSWRPRKERYIARLPHEPYAVRLVAAADKLHNAGSVREEYRTLGDALWAHFTGGREGTLWFYRAVSDALMASLRPREESLHHLLDQLEWTVSVLEREVALGLAADAEMAGS